MNRNLLVLGLLASLACASLAFNVDDDSLLGNVVTRVEDKVNSVRESVSAANDKLSSTVQDKLGLDRKHKHHKRHDKWEIPEFCREKDCPKFDVVKEYEEYEVREYERALFAYITVESIKYELAVAQGYAALTRYFNGYNKEGATLAATTPVLTLVPAPKDSGWKLRTSLGDLKENYTISFFLPYDYQGKDAKTAPQPRSDDLHVKEVDRQVVYTRNFTGFATEGAIQSQAKEFGELLDKQGEDFVDKFVWVGVYDPPTTLLNRYNEIFFERKSKKDSAVDAIREFMPMA